MCFYDEESSARWMAFLWNEIPDLKRSKGIPSVVDDMACIWQSLEALNNNSNLSKSRSTLSCNTKTPRKKVKGSSLKIYKTQQLTDVSNLHSGFALVSVEEEQEIWQDRAEESHRLSSVSAGG
jgi:hypothetical protein